MTHRGRVLLLLHRQKAMWLPPGGHLQPGESPPEAAVREVAEETGLPVLITSERVPPAVPEAAPRPEALLEVEVAPGHVHLDLVYFARPAPQADPEHLRPNDEADALRWWTRDDLLRERRPAGGAAIPPDVVALALRALDRGAASRG